MLTLHNNKQGGGLARRDFLRIGAMGMTGMTLAGLLRARAAAVSMPDYVRDKSVIFLFLAGGPSQYETFDPKLTAPSGIHAVTGEINTALPGVTFGSTFPALAALADKLAIVRSFVPFGGGAHEAESIRMLTGGTVEPRDNKMAGDGASIGALHARLRGLNNSRTGAPNYVMLMEPEIDEFYINFFLGCAELGSGPGALGPAYAPFVPSKGGAALGNMQLRIAARRLGDRRALLRQLDHLNRRIDSSGVMAGLDTFAQQAVEVIAGGAVRRALDLEQEDPRIVARYDTSHLRVYGHKQPSVSGPSTIGRQLLTARRLCQAGCGFVTVASSGWDMHGDGNNPTVERGFELVGRPLDYALSALLEDLEQQGMTRDVLVVITGEFGRSPRVNERGGREHWGGICPLALAGGGLKTGQVIGQSARNGDVPATEPITIPDLMSTITHTVFDVAALRLQTGLPRDLLKLTETGTPIGPLF